MRNIILALFLSILLNQNAMGEFTGGVESFNGTIKDTVTWEEYTRYSNTFSQNNALELMSPAGDIFMCDYTTKSIMIGVGQTVSVEILYFQVSAKPSTISEGGLFLTNDSQGISANTLADSQVIALEYTYGHGSSYPYGNSYFYTGVGGNNSLVGYTFGENTAPPSFSDPYLFSITRLTSHTAYYSAYHKNTMQIIGSRTFDLTNFNFDDNLYISLMANVPTVWDNVTIIPEPGSICLISLGSVLLFCKRAKRYPPKV